MIESYIELDDNTIFVRHNDFESSRHTVLFIHGLGESGLCFEEVFSTDWISNFNIIIPDLPGYGRSSIANSYSFDSQVDVLNKLLNHYQVKKCIVIGHSLGGDLGTILCTKNEKNRITQFINVEGNITQYELFISKRIVAADEKNEFDKWFEEFKCSTVLKIWGENHPSCKRYFASLNLARKQALIVNAKEIVRRNTSIVGNYRSEIGELYKELHFSKLYCFGTKSLSEDTIKFLTINKLDYISFESAFHWVMIDKKDEFYLFLSTWITKNIEKNKLE